MQLSFGQSMNLSGVDPAANDFDPLPTGWYAGVAVEIDVQQKDWGLGANVQMKVTEGQYANRLAFDFLTLMHRTSAQANDIGQKKLRQWCDATGTDYVNLQSAEPFLGKLVKFRLSVLPPKEYIDKNGVRQPGKSKNRIDAFAAYDAPSSAPAPVAAPAQQAVQPAPVQVSPVVAAQATQRPAGTMPWNRK